MKAVSDGPRKLEPLSRDKDGSPFSNYYTTPTGRLSSTNLMHQLPLHGGLSVVLGFKQRLRTSWIRPPRVRNPFL
ncbi:hypothetical protein TNCV_1249381 [Trichonephila clavipes]|nr:hypothetical protein TNCV_1249381 [Trichonephila clavipes]